MEKKKKEIIKEDLEQNYSSGGVGVIIWKARKNIFKKYGSTSFTCGVAMQLTPRGAEWTYMKH